MKREGDNPDNRDYLEVLLHHQDIDIQELPSSGFSSGIINTNIFEMFLAGTDTTTTTLEWAMAELLHNPMKLARIQRELRSLVGPEEKFEEEHIKCVPFLTAIVKETLRLHPPLPLLVPRRAMDSCQMLGYFIPQDTQILVNVWAISHDPTIWENPFKFMASDAVDYKGSHFIYLPFGAGRRICPAVPLVSRFLPLALGSLLHAFDLVLPDDLAPESMDMSETIGLSIRKASPLKVMLIPRTI